MNSRGISATLAGDARRCCAHPAVRRAGPRRALRGRGPLRPRRVRGPAADGRRRRGEARRPRRGAAGAAPAPGHARRPADPDTHAPRRTCRPAPTSRSTTRCPTPPFWGTRVVKGIPLADYASLLDERATFMGQWGLQARRAATGRRTRSSSRPRAGRGCGCGWTGSRPRGCSRRRSSTATSRCVSEGDDLVVLASRRRRGRAVPVHLPAAATRPAPVPGRLLPAARVRGGRRGRVPAGDDGPADRRGDRRAVRRATPTATTSSCTACRCSSPRRSPSTGTRGSAPSSASPARTPTGTEDYFDLGYRGARYSFGYGACPDLEDRAKLVELLEPERIGVELSEEFQLHPEQSTDAIVAAPPRGEVLQRPSEHRSPCRRLPAAVLFDMDGLLVDTERIWFEVESGHRQRPRRRVDRRGPRPAGRGPAGARRGAHGGDDARGGGPG